MMLDADGYATEATTANVLVYSHGAGLLTPPKEKILPGISLATLERLAADAGLPLAEQDLQARDFSAADEVLLCSTSPCLLPVTRLNGLPVGSGRPGKVFHHLLEQWSALVGLEIAEQAQKFSRR